MKLRYFVQNDAFVLLVMIPGKFNVLLDQAWGSSGKGKTSAWLADHFGVTAVSSSNFPNAGHTARFSDGTKFVAKAIPTAAILKKAKGMGMKCFISPGSGYDPQQLIKEWEECGKPNLYIHERASIVTDEHKKREADGSDSTKHVASTMQGTSAAIVDKILRRENVILARSGSTLDAFLKKGYNEEVANDSVQIVEAMQFRNLTYSMIDNGKTWLHEGSQGYALSIDHGSHYPYCTSRNCTLQAAMDHMAIPPSMIGDVYLNLRSVPIRVGNVFENGKQLGFSGGFYPDCEELTWEEVARRAGMPEDEAKALPEKERTTVTKRIRRVCTFSFLGLRDAVRTNGVTKIALNFVQYLNWNDAGIKGGREAFSKLSKESRAFISKVEDETGIPVVLIGTGADHEEMISLL
ncbi:MAG: adenylosuccinate synthetase [Lentisphaeria bacterium]